MLRLRTLAGECLTRSKRVVQSSALAGRRGEGKVPGATRESPLVSRVRGVWRSAARAPCGDHPEQSSPGGLVPGESGMA
jgi:hypothetical protein